MTVERCGRSVRTLRFRLMIWSAAVVLLTAFVTLIGLRVGVRHAIVHEVDAILFEDLNEIAITFTDLHLNAVNVEAAAAGQPGRLTEQLFEELDRKARGHERHGWFAQLLDEHGQEFWSSENAPGPAETRSLPDAPPGTAVSWRDLRLAERRMRFGAGPPLTIRVGASLQFLVQDMRRLDTQIAMIAGVVLIVAPLLGFFLADRTVRPLSTIIAATSQMHADQMDERLPVRYTGDELDQLAMTMNGLLDRLADHLAKRHDFLANSAHELRTPLAAIRSVVEVGLSAERSQEEYVELLSDVIEECTSLENLVNQLLLLAEAETDDFQNRGDRVNLTSIVERAVEIFQVVADSRDIDLQLKADPLVIVTGNRHRLRQVLNNLLDNAIKFTSVGGRVDVSVAPCEDRPRAVLTVADTGSGIPPDDLPLIFERFFRGDRSRSRTDESKGTGLGLSICAAVVEAHGGAIRVASKVGKGTTFTVELPLAPALEGVAFPAPVSAPHDKNPQTTSR